MNIAERVYKKLRREAVYLGRDIRYHTGLGDRFFKQARGSRILIYHGICRHDHTRFNPIFVTAKTFEEHLKLYKHYFNVVSLDDYYLQNFSNNKFNICLTFDDGFANNHQYVLPLLQKYQLPATFFVTAIREAGYDILWNDFLGIVGKYGPKDIWYSYTHYYKNRYNKYVTETGGSLTDQLRSSGFAEKAAMMEKLYPLVPFKKNNHDNDYWLQMTAQQIRELAASPYATVGAHGYYHNDLSKINIEDAETELMQTKQYLENLVQQQVKSFAFPYGAYTPQVIAAAKKTGYNKILAMDFYADTDHLEPALRERFTVNPFISPVNQMHATITRSYER